MNGEVYTFTISLVSFCRLSSSFFKVAKHERLRVILYKLFSFFLSLPLFLFFFFQCLHLSVESMVKAFALVIFFSAQKKKEKFQID